MQLVHIVHKIYEALEEGSEMRAVFLDISKAFGRTSSASWSDSQVKFSLRGRR